MATNYSHENYVDAFLQFMQTGDKEYLSPYLKDSRPEAFLSVYRNGFIRASASALESNFPCLVKLWGDDYFAQVAAAYVNVAPPVASTLIAYGFDDYFEESTTPSFIHFLKKDLSEVVADYPYVLDFCRLDQAWAESLNENGESFLSLEMVQEMVSQGVDLAELPLTLVDSSRIIDLEYDIFELWGQLRFAELSMNQKVELDKHDNALLFWQKEGQVQARPLTKAEAVFMKNLKQDADFESANKLASKIDEGFDLSTLFADLLTAQLLQQNKAYLS